MLESVIAAAGLLIGAPLMVLAAVAIRLTSPGPALFGQRRVGRHGREFTLYKLRTMRVGEVGPMVTAGDDPRVTRVGRWLRRTKIDELPQLWNVVRGEMALVGPRPEVPRYVDLKDPRWRRVLEIRPGLTDPVTLRWRDEEKLLARVTGDRERYYREVVQPLKLAGYVEFLDRRRGALDDLRVLGQTFAAVLGREPIRFEMETEALFLTGRTVMVTGAGGSIGAELARQVAGFRPAKLLLVERAEGALFEVERELREAHDGFEIAPLLADIGDQSRMQAIFARYRPQVVLHAAAHKHVPLVESNPGEAVKNNILATHRLGVLSAGFGVETFVLVSTDKAVRPTSVMGATKRVAELVIEDLNREHATRYVAVRFGNVIGSAGSVIPIFQRQIEKGGPLTVTHPEMERYFMSISEAARLVLQAGAMGEGGEVFILDMGEPVRILDLARATIEGAGLRSGRDIEIVFTGVRAGEKLVEELAMPTEPLQPTRHPKIFVGRLATSREIPIEPALDDLKRLADAGDDEAIRRLLHELVPESRLLEASENAEDAE